MPEHPIGGELSTTIAGKILLDPFLILDAPLKSKDVLIATAFLERRHALRERVRYARQHLRYTVSQGLSSARQRVYLEENQVGCRSAGTNEVGPSV